MIINITIFMNLSMDYLIVPPELEPVADVLLNSPDRPDTANRSVSTFRKTSCKLIVCSGLLDSDAWFVAHKKNDLQYFLRMPLEIRKRDVEGSWDLAVESMMRDGIGFHNPRGIVGSPGQ